MCPGSISTGIGGGGTGPCIRSSPGGSFAVGFLDVGTGVGAAAGAGAVVAGVAREAGRFHAAVVI